MQSIIPSLHSEKICKILSIKFQKKMKSLRFISLLVLFLGLQLSLAILPSNTNKLRRILTPMLSAFGQPNSSTNTLKRTFTSLQLKESYAINGKRLFSSSILSNPGSAAAELNSAKQAWKFTNAKHFSTVKERNDSDSDVKEALKDRLKMATNVFGSISSDLDNFSKMFVPEINEDPAEKAFSQLNINNEALIRRFSTRTHGKDSEFFNNLPKAPVSMHKEELIGKARKFFNEQQTKLGVLLAQSEIPYYSKPKQLLDSIIAQESAEKEKLKKFLPQNFIGNKNEILEYFPKSNGDKAKQFENDAEFLENCDDFFLQSALESLGTNALLKREDFIDGIQQEILKIKSTNFLESDRERKTKAVERLFAPLDLVYIRTQLMLKTLAAADYAKQEKWKQYEIMAARASRWNDVNSKLLNLAFYALEMMAQDKEHDAHTILQLNNHAYRIQEYVNNLTRSEFDDDIFVYFAQKMVEDISPIIRF